MCSKVFQNIVLPVWPQLKVVGRMVVGVVVNDIRDMRQHLPPASFNAVFSRLNVSLLPGLVVGIHLIRMLS